jgi:hypothetical protein
MDIKEERFRAEITGFPDIIEIDKTVQEALDCLEALSSEEVWKRAPSTIRQAGVPPVPPSQGVSPSVTSNFSESSSSSDSDDKAKQKRAKRPPKNPKAPPSNRNPQDDRSTKSVTSSVVSKQRDSMYRALEEKLNSVQDQRDSDMKRTRAHLNDIDTKLLQLNRIEDLEEKAIKSMQYHVQTNTAITEVQGQMPEMMHLLRHLATYSPGQASGPLIHMPTITQAASVENRSAASSSSGSTHAKPPPKKNRKRAMSDNLETKPDPSPGKPDSDMDSVSADSFGSTPPSDFLRATVQPPEMMLTSSSPSGSATKDPVEHLDVTLTIPDLEDQYKLSDEEFNAPYNPDGTGPG